MTESVQGFTVTLAKDIREDDAKIIQQAIAMIKGVIHVEPNMVTHQDHTSRERFRREMRKRLGEYLDALPDLS